MKGRSVKKFYAYDNDIKDTPYTDRWKAVYLASEVDALITEGKLTGDAQRDAIIEHQEARIAKLERDKAQMQIEIDAVTRQRDETYAKLVEAREQIQKLTFGGNK